jgi:flagella basal body P-ring formation protein FlgA
VRLHGGATVITLADVAEMDGPQARALADLAIAEVTGAEVEITVAQVRRALGQAGVNWGRLNLSGRRTLVRASRVQGTAPPMAMSALSLTDPSRPQRAAPAPEGIVAADLAGEATLRGDLARFLATALQVPADALRLRFQPGDEQALRAPTSMFRFEKQPHGQLDNETVEMTIRAWKGNRIEETRVLRIGLERRAEALAATCDIARGDVVRASDVETIVQWMPPRAAAGLAGIEDLGDATAADHVAPGQVLHKTSLRPPLLVRRGDLLVVRCLVGGLVVSLKAEARADAARGETIPMRKPRERETFLATVTRPGEAVVDLGKDEGTEGPRD